MTDAPPLPPPIRPLGVPPYYLLNEQPKTFERLTRALLAADPNLAGVDMFGVGGQSQYGVDVVAHAAMGPGRTVASCKCVRTATRGDLKTWSTDFLDYRDAEWRDVGRFILVTSATNITDTKLLDQREAEAQRFAQHGVEYIVWGPDQLTDAIAVASASVARQFLGQAWEEALHPRERGELTAGQAAQLTRLQGLVSRQASARLVLGTELMRSGQFEAASTVVSDLRQPEAWDQLSEQVQAQALRLQGFLADAAGDTDTAGKLAGQALALDPTERRLSALLRAKAHGALAGLELLGEAVRRSDRQLEIGLLLEAGQLPKATEKLETLLAEDLEDSESQRLVAHLRVIENRRAEALGAARLAHDLAPSRLSTERTLAMVCYAAALSPMTPAEQTTIPNPFDPDLIRTDAAGLALMGEARDLFGRLILRSSKASAERVWLLACLANLPDEREAAGDLCRELLRAEPTSGPALAWGLARDLTFDRATSREALQALYDRGEADENQVQALVHLSAADVDPDSVRRALEPALHRQSQEPAAAARLLLDALEGKPEPDAANLPSLAQAIGWAQDNDDWSQVATCLGSLLGGTTPTPQGLGLARFCAQNARWEILAPHVGALVRFETGRALELAVLVLHHTGTPEAVLALLEAKADLFPAIGAPLTVRRVEIVARHALGQLPSALQLAEQLAAETSEMYDRLRAADIHLAAGHTQAALPAIRVAASAKSLTSDEAVRYSIAVTRDDPALATRLWRQAMELGVTDEMLLHALSQGYKLGLDEETGPLFPRLQARALSGAGDVWMVDLDQVVRQMLAHRDRSENLSEQLAAGAFPIHLVARALNHSVAELYWFKPRFAAKGAVSPLFIRHGGRPPGHHPKLPWPEWRLHLDLTGLLIADQLDLWTHLDDLQTAVTISRALPDALIKLEHDAAHHQLTQVKAAKAITDARLTGRLTARGGGLGGAQTVGHDRDEPEVDHADFTVAAVIAATRGEAAAQGGASPSGRLSFTQGSIHALAMTEDFDAVIDTFVCDVDEDDFEAAVEELRRAAARETLADWIEEVKKKVAERVEDGRFTFPTAKAYSPTTEADEAIATEQADHKVGSTAGGRRSKDFIEESLLELLAVEGDDQCALWVDDRLLSGYRVAEGKIVVGVTDILDVLAAESRITADERRRALLNLRRAGSVFIPLDATEVLPSLSAAQTVEGELVETADLATYRRNLAAASRLDAQLKVGPSPIEALRDRPDEVSFMLDSRKVASELLIALWDDPTFSDEEARARSDWVWASLRLEQPLRVLPGGDESAQLLASLAIAALLAQAAHLGDGWSDSAAAARRQAFAAWLDETAIEPREGPGADRFFDLIADEIAASVDGADVESLAASLGVEPAQAERILLPHRQRLFDLMPEPIQQRLVQNTTFATAAGVGSIDLVTLNGVTFPPVALWSACAEALRNGTASVETQDGTRVEIVEQNGALAFSGGLAVRVKERFFPALKAEGEARALATSAFLAELDLAPEAAEAADRSIAAAESDSDLVSGFQRAQEASVVYRYAHLSDFVRDRGGISTEMLAPPVADQLLHHLRLSEREGSIADAMPQAWADLAAKLGVRHAFRRLSGLPVPLSRTIVETLSSQSLRQEDLGAAAGPVAQLHLAAIAHQIGDAPRTEGELKALIEGLPSSGKLFARLLGWTHRAFVADAGWRALEPGAQLALVWSHAHRICSILLEHGVDCDQMGDFLAERPAPRELGSDQWRRVALDRDCASPTFFFPTALPYHGLAYVYGDADILDAAPGLTDTLGDLPFLDPAVRDELQPGVFTRDPSAPNAMGSFLQLRPVGLLPKAPDPDQARAAKRAAALLDLEADPTRSANWLSVLVFGQPGLAADERDRLDAVFRDFNLAQLDVTETSAPTGGYDLVVEARVRLGGPLDPDTLGRKLFDLASELAAMHRVRFNLDDDGAASKALRQVLEAAARGSMGEDIPHALDRFVQHSLAVAAAWPASAASLRTVFDAYVRRMAPSHGAPLWRGLVALRAWP